MTSIENTNWTWTENVEAPKAQPQNQRVDVVRETRTWMSELSLEQLREKIESEKLRVDSFKETLSLLETLPESQRPYVIAILIAWLNKRWISFKVEWNKVVLGKWKDWIIVKEGETAWQAEVSSYESILNNYLKVWKISTKDLFDAMLFRTSATWWYLSEKSEWQEISTTDYFLRLCKKYNVFEGAEFKSFTELKTFIKWMDERMYRAALWNVMKDDIRWNQADKEFILNYLNDIRYNDNKNIDENSIKRYKTTIDPIKSSILEWVSKLSTDQMYALWVTNESEAEELKTKITNNPIGFLTEDVIGNPNAMGLWIIWSIIMLILWEGIGWALVWFLWWAWIVAWFPFIKEVWRLWLDASSEWQAEWSEWNNHGLLVDKFWSLFISEIEWYDKTKIDEILESLWKNQKFLLFDASILDIFKNEKDFTKIKELFKNNFWIELTWENKKYYEYIFAEIKKSRVGNIWEYVVWENLKTYLSRTSRIVAGWVAWWAVWAAAVEGAWWDIEAWDHEVNKKELLTFFWVNDSQIEQITGSFESLWLDIFPALKKYYDFINLELKGLDRSILDKIKRSIIIKLSLINKKVSELRKEELEEYWNLDNFKNNRWIVNTYIVNLLNETNTRVLPSAYALLKNIWDRDKLEKTREMFNSSLTDEWDFDKTWDNFELYDSIANSWEVFDMSDDIEFFNSQWLNTTWLEWINFLNEKDIEIESDAIIAYLIASVIQVVPYAWAVVSLPAMTIDTFSDKDWTLELLQTLSIVEDDFRMEKRWWDNVLWWVWLIATIFWVQWAVRWVKISEKFPVLAKVKFDKIEDILQNISSKLWMSKEHTNFISTKLKQLFRVWDDVWENVDNILKWQTKFITKYFDSLKPWDKKEISGLKIEKLQSWRFKIDWEDAELSLKQLTTRLNNLPIDKREEFILGVKRTNVLNNYNWKVAKIDWHEVSVENWSFKIRDYNTWDILSWDNKEVFINTHIDEIAKKLLWLTAKQARDKAVNWIVTWYEKMWVKNLKDFLLMYSDKAWYINWRKSTFLWKWSNKLDSILWVVLTPATTIRQLVWIFLKESDWKEIMRFLISWNKYKKVWWESWAWFWRILDAWATRAVWIWALSTFWIPWLIDADDILIDRDISTWDEILDYAFYTYWWVINTLIAKAVWIID